MGQCMYCALNQIHGQEKPELLARPPAKPTLYQPTTREIPPPKYAHPEVVAWLTERCPSRVSPYSGHMEMEMPRTGTAFVELIAAAIEHGRSLGPRLDEATPEATRDRFDMLEMEDLEG